MEQKYIGLIVLGVILIVVIVALIIWWAVSCSQDAIPECTQVNNITVQPAVDDGIPFIPDDDEPKKPEPVKTSKASRSQVLAFNGNAEVRDNTDGDGILIKRKNDFTINMGRLGKGSVLSSPKPILFDDCLKDCRKQKECVMATYDTTSKLCTLFKSNDGFDVNISHITLIKN